MAEESTVKELQEIANKLGITVEQLKKTGKSNQQIITEYKQGKLQILND